MKIGDKLKYVRNSLGINQQKMANGVINRSFYSRVENNQYEIRVSHFLKILANHQIPLLQFLSDFGDVKSKNNWYENQIEAAFFDDDLQKLNKIMNTKSFTNLKVKQVTEFLIYKIEDKTFPNSKARELRNSIFKIEHWDEDSLWIFVNTMDLYPLSDLQGLTNSIFLKYKKQDIFEDRLLQLLADITVRYLSFCVKDDRLEHEFNYAMEFLNQLPSSTLIMIQKMTALALFKIQKKDCKGGKEILQLIREQGYSSYLNKNLMILDEKNKNRLRKDQL